MMGRLTRIFAEVVEMDWKIILLLGLSILNHAYGEPKFIVVGRSAFSTANKPDVDLRGEITRLNIPIRNQGSRNTCSVHVMTFLLEYNQAEWLGESGMDLSEEYLNWAANTATLTNADGGFFTEMNTGYQTLGIARESALAYQSTFMTNQPTIDLNMLNAAKKMIGLKFEIIKPWKNTEGATDIQIRNAATALLLGMPVGMGSLWQKSTTDMEVIEGLNFVKTPAANNVSDGHSVSLVGFKYSNLFPGGGYFIIRNSWGTGFGDSGYAYITFDFVKKFANDLVYYHR